MLRGSFFRTTTVPIITISSVLYQSRTQASTAIPLDPEAFLNLCENTYSRFKQNPFSTTPLLLQYDDKKPYGVVSQYSFEKIAPMVGAYERIVMDAKKDTQKVVSIDVPWIHPAIDISGFKDLNGDIILQGYILDRMAVNGRPLCKIVHTPKSGPSQQYILYALQPKTDQLSPITIPRFRQSEEAKQIKKQKSGTFKTGNQPSIDAKSVAMRMAITTRTPDQNKVMGLRAVDEYSHCVEQYEDILYPPLKKMLLHSSQIMHLSTLEAMQKRSEKIPAEVKMIAYRDRLLRTEWLHLIAFFSYPMHKEPQKSSNLGAARACINTRMLLLEYLTRWYALNMPNYRTSLSCRFDLLLDTNVIDKIKLSATIDANGAQCKLTQTIDPLTINPEQISGSDLAIAVTSVKMLLEKATPLSKQTVKLDQSASVVRMGDSNFFRRTPPQTFEVPTFQPKGP